jgi:hypothetical protein
MYGVLSYDYQEGRRMSEKARTTIFLEQADRDAIKFIREATGCGTDASAVRFAIRQVARELERKTRREPKPSKGGWLI